MGDTPAIPGSTYPSGAPTEPVFSEQDFKNFQACLDKGWVNTGDHYAGPPPLIENLAPSAWSPSFVKLFSSINAEECNLGTEETTDYQKLLAYYIQSILLPILCQYQNDPDEFKYALFLFNQIVENLCRASRLERDPHWVGLPEDPFKDVLVRYFTPPSSESSVYPVERQQAGLELQSVDPFNFVNYDVIEMAKDIWRDEIPPTDNLDESWGNVEEKARKWSLYTFENSLIAPPRIPVYSNGDLSLELGWNLPNTFTSSDERFLYAGLMGYSETQVAPPENAAAILRNFKDGLNQLKQNLSGLSLPPQAQLFGAEQIVLSTEQEVILTDGQRVSLVPEGGWLSQWGVDNVRSIVSEYDNNAKDILASEFLDSDFVKSLKNTSEKKWSQIQEKFKFYYKSSSAWQSEVEGYDDPQRIEEKFENTLEVMFQQGRTYYNDFFSLSSSLIFSTAEPHVILNKIQDIIKNFEAGISSNADLSEDYKQVYRYYILLMLRGVAEVLEENQESVKIKLEVFKQNPKTASLAEIIPIRYEWTTSIFRVLADSYKDYIESNPTQAEWPSSPYVTNTVLQLGEMKEVLSYVENNLPKTPLPLRQALPQWVTYRKMKDELQVADVKLTWANPLFSFLEGNGDNDAIAFYKALYEKTRGMDLGSMWALQDVLLKYEQILSDEATRYLLPDDAFRFMNRLRYAAYLFAYYLKLEEFQTERKKMDLSDLINSDLQLWIKNLPMGWPEENGCTVKYTKEALSPPSICPNGGFKGDFTLTPNPENHLTKEAFVSLFQLDSDVSKEETLSRLVYFFGDFDDGYYKYFSYGGYEENFKEEKIGYIREHVALNQLLLILQDIYKACEARPDDPQAQRVGYIARELAFRLDELLHSRRADDPFYALIDTNHLYLNILPSGVLHTFDPTLDYGGEPSVTDLRVSSLLWRSEHQPYTLLDEPLADFKIVALSSSKAFKGEAINSNELEFFETALKDLKPKLTPFEKVDWYLRKGYSPENSYLLGRLLERSESKAIDRERFEEMRKVLQRTRLDQIGEIPAYIKYGHFRDKSFLLDQGLPEETVDLLVSLTPEETIWFSGYVTSQVALSERVLQNEESRDDTYFEETRRLELDDFIFGLTPQKAREAVAQMVERCGLEELRNDPIPTLTDDQALAVMGTLDQYFENPQLVADRQRADALYIRLNERYREDGFTRFENLYLLYLISNDFYHQATDADLVSLKKDFSIYNGNDFKSEKAEAFYKEIPELEKPIVYTFLFNLCFDSYRKYMWGYFSDVAQESSVLMNPKGIDGGGNQFWKWYEAKLRSPLDEEVGVFEKDEFDSAEVVRIAWAWRKYRLNPPLPNQRRLNETSLAKFLNKVSQDPNFYVNNQSQLDSLLDADTRAKVDARGVLDEEGSRRLNLLLLSKVDPVLSVQNRGRKKLVEEVDEILSQDFGDKKKNGDIVLDIPTQLVLGEAFKNLQEIFGTNPESDFVRQMEDILMGPFDASDPLQNKLYSRYNPNRKTHNPEAPPELPLVYSRDFFSAQIRIDNPFLLDDVQSILNDMLHIVDGGIQPDQYRQTIMNWRNPEAIKVIIEADYYAGYTVSFYEYYNYQEVQAVKGRLDEVSKLLKTRLKELEQ